MHQLFVTQIYQTKINTDFKDLKKEIYQIKKVDILGQKWSKNNYQNGYTSYGSLDQLHKLSSTFLALEKKINRSVFKYAQNLDYNIKKADLKMTRLWVNIMPAGTLHAAHIHPLSVISGVFFVDTPVCASAIKFEDPRLGLFMNTPPLKDKTNKINSRFYSIQPKTGDLLLFESWLKHEVPVNKSNKPRISISFNYSWS